MSVSFEGVGQVCTTFLGGGLTEGHVVKLAGNGTVGACSDGDGFIGAAVCCKDDACTVQVRGFVTVRYSGAAPGTGQASLCGNGQGGVRAAADADVETQCLVVDVDAAANAVTILL